MVSGSGLCFDPACFIGWECRVVQFDKYVFVFWFRADVRVGCFDPAQTNGVDG